MPSSGHMLYALSNKPPLRVVLASPRGFCAGVSRAILIVEKALERYGPPVYVRHEIVHNRYVVEELKTKGAVFVDELEEVPPDAMVVFSAHGVPKAVPEDARRRGLAFLDATCPLVSKVHREAERHAATDREIVLIGHAGHPEVAGTMGQLPPGAITLVETLEDVAAFTPRDPERLAYITQTTLSVEDTAAIIHLLQERFPAIEGPHREDICYATTNRQEAVRAVAPNVEAMLIIGAPNSSNSLRLVEVAQREGCTRSILLQRARDMDWPALEGLSALGIAAGASAPEVLVEEVLDALRTRFTVSIQEVQVREEHVRFKLPRALDPACTPDE